jgi:cholinesterase
MLSFVYNAVLFGFALQLANAYDIRQVVKTTSGNLKGQPSSWKPQVSEYLGIPFVKPTVGTLRFAAPVRYSGLGDYDATRWGNDCPTSDRTTQVENLKKAGLPLAATIYTSLIQIGHNFSEDCLTLNVWSKPQIGEKAKAVLLWIYGGGMVEL